MVTVSSSLDSHSWTTHSTSVREQLTFFTGVGQELEFSEAQRASSIGTSAFLLSRNESGINAYNLCKVVYSDEESNSRDL
jgi:hypothetical protein